MGMVTSYASLNLRQEGKPDSCERANPRYFYFELKIYAVHQFSPLA